MTPTADNRFDVAHEIDVEIACRADGVPAKDWLAGCVALALGAQADPVSVAVRIVDADEIRSCNARYRGRDRATNVLSFPAQSPAPLGVTPLGDILVCAPVVAEEATERGVPAPAHWAHMLIHGTLHLLGFDHEREEDAEVMESREIELLAAAGFPNPYI